MAQLVKNLPAMWETWVRSLGWEDPRRRERLPTPVFWPGEFHGQSIESQRVGHDQTTFTHTQEQQGGVEHGGWCINSKVRLREFESQPYHYVII